MKFSGELVFFIITFLVWMVGAIAERKKRAEGGGVPAPPEGAAPPPPLPDSRSPSPQQAPAPLPPQRQRKPRAPAPIEVQAATHASAEGWEARPAGVSLGYIERVVLPSDRVAERDATSGMLTLRSEAAHVTQSRSAAQSERTALRLGLLPGAAGHEALRRAVLLSSILAAPRAMAPWRPPGTSPET